MDVIKCYCDASFSPKHKYAVLGWQIGNEHMNILRINNTNNTRAEFEVMIKLLECLSTDHKYIIYTDCQGITRCLNKKQKLIDSNFKNRKGQELANADIYKKLYELFLPNMTIVHIDGHIPTKLMSEDNKKFSHIDRTVRSILRQDVCTM